MAKKVTKQGAAILKLLAGEELTIAKLARKATQLTALRPAVEKTAERVLPELAKAGLVVHLDSGKWALTDAGRKRLQDGVMQYRVYPDAYPIGTLNAPATASLMAHAVMDSATLLTSEEAYRSTLIHSRQNEKLNKTEFSAYKTGLFFLASRGFIRCYWIWGKKCDHWVWPGSQAEKDARADGWMRCYPSSRPYDPGILPEDLASSAKVARVPKSAKGRLLRLPKPVPPKQQPLPIEPPLAQAADDSAGAPSGPPKIAEVFKGVWCKKIHVDPPEDASEFFAALPSQVALALAQVKPTSATGMLGAQLFDVACQLAEYLGADENRDR